MIQTLSTNKTVFQSFSINTQAFGSTTAYRLLNENTGESATIIPSEGAMLNSLALIKGSQIFEIIDGNVNESEMKAESNILYKSRILFPFPNRIKGGLYIFEGKMYQFETIDRGNALHGLCNNANFEVINQEVKKSKASLTLGYKLEGIHAAYPFQMNLTVVYELSKKGLLVWTEVKNTGTKTAPFGLGWHPYFKTGTKVDDLELWFPPHRVLPTDDQLIPTGKRTEGFSFTNFERLDAVELDNGFEPDTDLKSSSIRIKDPVKDFTIELTMDEGYDFFHVYTPQHRNSIAIEPETCAANAFNNKIGLMELKEGEKRDFQFSISIS